MRLIDADKLKEEVVKLCERINANNGVTVPTLAFTRIIDNAPAVEAFTENDKALAYCEGYVRGSHEAYIRPQGESVDATKTADDLFKKLIGGGLP